MNELYMSAGICFAGMVSGAFGFAFPLIAGPLLLLMYKPSETILLTALCSLFSNILTAVLLRHSIKYQLRWQLIAPMLIGLPIGTALVTHMGTTTILRTGFGMLLVITSAISLLPWKMTITGEHSFTEVIVGILGGIVGGMFAASITSQVIWLTMKGLEKVNIRALLQPLIMVSQMIIVILIICDSGSVKPNMLYSVSLYMPAALLGALFGVSIFKSISTNAYTTAINALIFISGVILIVK
jgi:uncharacterized protein